MKPKLLLVLPVLFPVILFAQYPCVNGISTNPANPINNQLPSKANTFFNWQKSTFDLQPSPNCFRTSSIESPFFKIDNLEVLRESKDMNWSDGWELIRRGVGLTESNTYTASNPEHIYVILYNKYTGILRILLQTCRGEDYNAAKVKLSFDNTSSIKTDLLEFARGDIGPLQKTFAPVEYAAGAEYFNENSKWFYADFPMMYDPCTCIYRSKLKIISELISSSQITIEGGITGEIYTQTSGGYAQIKKPGSYSWKDFASGVNRFSTVNASIEKFRDETQKFAAAIDTSRNSAIGSLSQFLAKNDFLKAGLKFAPFVSSAVGLINTFIGGGKQTPPGPQEVKLLPLTANLTARLNGTITTTSPYHQIIFTNPGSKDADQDPDAYPYYNEVMGVFNLINTPEVWWERRTEKLNDWYNYPWLNSQDVTVDRFKIDTNTFKWVLNPAAGMTIQNMKLALVSEATYEPSYYEGDSAFWKPFMNPDFHEYIGKDGVTSQYKFTTQFFDGKCFAEKTFKVLSNYSPYVPDSYFGMWSAWRPKGIISNDTTAYLKVMLNLKRDNATATTQNILYVATYPVTLKNGGYMQYWINSGCDAWNADTTLITPASSSEIISFCNSNLYYNSQRFQRSNQDQQTQETIVTGKDISISPNPNQGKFYLKLSPQQSSLKNIKILDVNGRVVFSSMEGSQNLQSGFTKQLNVNLPSGLYIVLCTTEQKIYRSKFVVAK